MGYENICRRLLEYGVLAPSIYNSQPWRFSVQPESGVIRVYGDEKRVRPRELDPNQRDLYLSLGACVENMVLAASALGYEIKENLFPKDGSVAGAPIMGQPIAQLALKPLPEAQPETLFSTMLVRQTHSGPYQAQSVRDIHLDRLRNLPPFSPDEKIYLIQDVPTLGGLISFLHDLSHEGALKASWVEEGARWITPKLEAQEGLPLATLGLPLSVKVRFAFLRTFGLQREIREVSRQTLLRQGHGIEAPAFLLMTTKNPRPRGYFNAGRWQTSLTLTLSEMELGSQSLHLPIGLVEAHAPLKGFFKAGEGEEPVLLLRFGQPVMKRWPRTSRRLVHEVLVTDGSR